MLDPKQLMIDFEKTAINAFSHVFPATNITRCLFHLAINIYRHVVNPGLNIRYWTESEFNIKINCFTVLAFLLIHNVINRFLELTDDDELLQEIVSISKLTT